MLRVGIFFGGPSREREISFAGGRTVYDNLDKRLFEPIPIFIDSFRNLILLDWQYIYKGSIRDFYPPIGFLPKSKHPFQIYAESLGKPSSIDMNQLMRAVGTPIKRSDLADLIDFAFLALHGLYGEDGQIQQELETLGIPYSGSGILPSSIGINKALQKRLMEEAGMPSPHFEIISKKQWRSVNPEEQFKKLIKALDLPLVIRPANQGSSIGVSIVRTEHLNDFKRAMDDAFFSLNLQKTEWEKSTEEEKLDFIRKLVDIRSNIGFPLLCAGSVCYHPDSLLKKINQSFAQGRESLLLEALDSENEVIVESFIDGREFSCIVIRTEEDKIVALPPTEIKKGKEIFDYRSKYLAGLSRKVTPIDLPEDKINKIRTACEELFDFFHFNVYARIDGFIQKNGSVYLNDPNTTSGMLPSSFFFHQAAEIGLNPSQFLTYIIRTSLHERICTGFSSQQYKTVLKNLDDEIMGANKLISLKTSVAVVMGGYSSERHISVESGRNVYEKLASSSKYAPIPVFLTSDAGQNRLFKIPINLLLKDNADDIREQVLHFNHHAVIDRIRESCCELTLKYAGKDYQFEPVEISFEELPAIIDAVFLALHGRPGEDGAVQQKLEAMNLPYNGSRPEAAALTIDKFRTNELLAHNGIKVAAHRLIDKLDYLLNPQGLCKEVEKAFDYPFIAKPVDDGCSSAVKKIHERKELKAYLNLLFRDLEALPAAEAALLGLKPKEEIPMKEQVMIEALIGPEGAKQFLEITGGMLSHYDKQGKLSLEVFEPSEVLAGESVLSLEEKFLAGQGQNITPARFGHTQEEYMIIAAQLKATLKRVAEILNIEGYCRIDAFVRVFDDLKIETIIIEVNSLPGMTPATCIFHQAAINTYKPFNFIDQILEFGKERNKLKIC